MQVPAGCHWVRQILPMGRCDTDTPTECQAASPGSRAAEELSGDVALQACIAATTSCVAVGNGYNPKPAGHLLRDGGDAIQWHAVRAGAADHLALRPEGCRLSVSVGGATATITGQVTGTFTGSTFNLSGTTSVTVPVFGKLSGSLKADNAGVASCANTSSSTQVGFEYTFVTGGLKVLDSKGCSEKGF